MHFSYDMGMSLWRQGKECNGLDMKCLAPQRDLRVEGLLSNAAVYRSGVCFEEIGD
jgi:hypothetical protein